MDVNSSEAAPEPVRFRAGKKRKAYRQRALDNGDAVAETTKSPTTSTQAPNDEYTRTDTHDGDEDGDGSVAAALKMRNTRRGRLGGVAFRNTNRPDDETNNERALVPHDAEDTLNSETVIKGVTGRFTHQTGRLTDLNDKHMMDFIESRLSNRAGGNSSQTTLSASKADPAKQHPTAASNESGRAVMQGQLMEIDLGDHIQGDNAAHGERAIQGDNTTEGGRRAKKPRLRRDGKPWRPRNRRDSDALKRDQIVDEILRETRRTLPDPILYSSHKLIEIVVDLYEPPEQNSNNADADQDGAADERLAEEFRQQFFEDVAERQLRKKKTTNQPARAGTEEVLKGPKLGGSRNARAQMRDLLLKKEKEGKK
ncbi:hypothetical protein F53441_11154 [Fusarium austroafricanum]|uniref:Uncharacterized protein n=1 Tax=Fusarium austroafricanum TaxID=2364996 RepID=A0A8H4K617_9HYPO|nr:hypothetical protein F53441_11154 [Fusarium austroafricanum]